MLQMKIRDIDYREVLGAAGGLVQGQLDHECGQNQ